MKIGKVYFVSAPGRIKIGFTRSPERRLIALRRADMEELTALAIIDGERALEKKLHELLDGHRLRGEWFVDCPEVRQVIDDAIAGKHAIEDEPAPESPDDYPLEDIPPSPEFEIIQNLADEAEASLARNDDKYEVRGRVQALLAASEVFIRRRMEKEREIDRTVARR